MFPLELQVSDSSTFLDWSKFNLVLGFVRRAREWFWKLAVFWMWMPKTCIYIGLPLEVAPSMRSAKDGVNVSLYALK